MRRLNVAIVGCGVAGTTATLLLARSGHRVTLFEQSPQVGPVGAGILLQPSGQAVLAAMGLLDRVIANAEPIGELYARVHRGGDLVRLRYADLSPGLRGYGLHRGDLFTVLHHAVIDAGVELRLNQTVTSYEQNADRVTLPDQGEFDLLIAADGARSRLRAASGIRHWAWPYAHGAFWTIGQCAAVKGQLLQVANGTRELCGMVPMGGGRCSLFWGIPKSSLPQVYAGGFAKWKATVLDRQPLAAELLAALSGFDNLKFVSYQHVHMTCRHRGRVVFLGDAAHAMSPQLGQGVNLALVDAWALAGLLDRSPVGQALQQYEHARRRHLFFYSWISFALAPFFQSSVDGLGFARNLALPWFPRVSPVYRLMLQTLAGNLGLERSLRQPA